ncbi:hypothetical protein Mmol_0967 [Methylotenera mobilis JLW8]|uniref:Uncharacterized protein n=1 Tax=Methylotenera mobilis (strain JLW8 / ATCC BAA-1282 / DSM 17540) TaxID=583345 RepID=C6WVC7_METML|nr:hypothetical protein Mmol_0967 [Methylotenera mobilis JLW8]
MLIKLTKLRQELAITPLITWPIFLLITIFSAKL